MENLFLMPEPGDNVQKRTSRGEGKGGTYQQLQTSGGQRKSVFGVCHVYASFGTFIHVNGHSLEEATCCAAGGRRVRLAGNKFPLHSAKLVTQCPCSFLLLWQKAIRLILADGSRLQPIIKGKSERRSSKPPVTSWPQVRAEKRNSSMLSTQLTVSALIQSRT